jgi:uncharacterized RDD family membrane protein YckC
MTSSTKKAPESSPPPAPLWRRLVAMLYDSLLLIAVVIAYGYLHLAAKVWLLGDTYKATLKTSAAGSTADSVMFAGVIIVIFLFFHIFWQRQGQTLGMQAWRIRLQSEDGQKISVKQTVLRLLIAPCSAFCFGLGYLWCLFAPYKTWQDMATGSQVVVLPKHQTD